MAAQFEVLKCTGRDAARWQSLIDRLVPPYQDIMFTPAYARVQQSIGRGECYAAVYQWGDNFVLHPFVQEGVQLGSFYGGGGSISDMMGAADYRLWLYFDLEFAEWRREHKIKSEYVRLHPLFTKQQRRMLREAPLKVEHLREAVVVDIDLSDEKLLASFSRNRQRGVQDGVEAGVRVERAEGIAAFAEVYRQSLLRLKAQDYWFYPNATWQAYKTELGDQHITILTAKAGSGVLWPHLMVLHAYGKAYAHFLGSDPLSAPGINDQLYFEAMKYCRDVGCHQMFLGGGLTANPADSLLAYKKGYSKTLLNVYFYQRDFAEAEVKQSEGEKKWHSLSEGGQQQHLDR